MNKQAILGHYSLLGQEVTLIRREKVGGYVSFEVLTAQPLPTYTFIYLREALKAFSDAIDLCEAGELPP